MRLDVPLSVKRWTMGGIGSRSVLTDTTTNYCYYYAAILKYHVLYLNDDVSFCACVYVILHGLGTVCQLVTLLSKGPNMFMNEILYRLKQSLITQRSTVDDKRKDGQATVSRQGLHPAMLSTPPSSYHHACVAFWSCWWWW